MGINLGLSFGLLIAILLGTAYLSLERMQRMNGSLQQALNEDLLELQLAQEGLRYSSENSRITMQIFLVQQQEVIDQLLARRAENTRRISALLPALEARCQSGEEKRLMETLKQTRTAYVDSYQRALHLLLQEKKKAAATDVIVQEATPALFRYHAAWEEFLRFQLEDVKKTSEQGQRQYATAERIMLLFILLVGGLAGAIAIVATRKVARVVTSRLRVQEKIYKLNAELERESPSAPRNCNAAKTSCALL